MHIFKWFENQRDTCHDTQTHYLMEQDPLLLKDQADGMDVAAAVKVEALKKKDGPSRARLKSIWFSVLQVYACGPRDIISLVIPRLGDNIDQAFVSCKV
jgi:hypothetical protein